MGIAFNNIMKDLNKRIITLEQKRLIAKSHKQIINIDIEIKI